VGRAADQQQAQTAAQVAPVLVVVVVVVVGQAILLPVLSAAQVAPAARVLSL
jgi:hypothetical protein